MQRAGSRTLIVAVLVALGCSDKSHSSAAGGAGGGAGTGATSSGGSAQGGQSATGGQSTTGGQGGSGGAPEVACDATCHFVRAGASGDGTDWDNALAELPATLERGHRYYVAAGTYAAYTFDDAADADNVITVVHATDARHGTDTGWQTSYGDPAQFGPLSFSQPYYVFDGQSAGGFEVLADFQGDAVSISGDHVAFRHTDVNGNFGTDSTGYHDRGACTGMSISSDYVTVSDSTIHDSADDGVSIDGASHVEFTGNVIHALHACGTDGACGPCYNGHSDGFETYNVKHGKFIGNLVYDVRSTSTFFFGNWADTLGNGPSEYCEDMLIENNVFYAPEVGLVAYIQDVAGAYVYNNVFWGQHQGGYGGLSVGLHVSDLWLYNNVILSINMTHVGATYDATQHHGDYNLFGLEQGPWVNSAHDKVAADPGFVAIPDMDGAAVTDPSATDFTLKATSPAVNAGYPGDATIAIPSTDFSGAPRDAKPDIGAFEQ